jgi:DNA-binding beta-propeller fold protein YncE
MMRRVYSAPLIGALLLVATGTLTLPAAASSAPATSSTSLTYAKTLAGPSEAAMYPSGLIWDAHSNRLVVADTGDNKVSIFTPSTCPAPPARCTPVLSFGTYGTGNGQFNTPRDVAVDGSSNIYVADAANSRIEAFSPTGVFLWSAGGLGKLSSNLNVPIGLSYDATTNEILVADTGHSLIKAYAAVGGAEGFAAGTYIWKSPTGILKSPREVRRGPDGEIWVADYHNEKVEAFQCTCTSSSSDWNSTPNKVIGDGLANGHANGEVNSPYNIAFSPNGEIGYVADTGNERIGVFNVTSCTGTLNGQRNECAFIANFGSRCPKICPLPPGNAAYFEQLRRVTVDSAGNIWAADFWGSGIHEFTPAGATGIEIDGAPALAPGFAEAYGVTVGSNGFVYGVDRLNQRVEEFNASGTYLTDEGTRGTAVGDYSWPETAGVAPNGDVWVGDTRNNRLEEYSAGLTLPAIAVVTGGGSVGAFNYIEGVSVAANGVVWVADTDNNRIVSYNPTGAHYTAFGTRGSSTVIGSPAQFIDPEGVVASSSDFYVADTGNSRVDEVDMSGNLVAVFTTGLNDPEGITLASDGTVWVANTQADQVVQLSSNLSSELTSFGTPGSGIDNFDLPHSLAVSGSTLYVADTYNNRIQEFTIG